MKEFFQKTYYKLILVIEIICALLLIIMIGINTIGVFYRYVLGNSIPWVSELSRYLLIWLTLLGSVIALEKNEHVSVSFFYRKLPSMIKFSLNILKYILIGYFSYILLTAGLRFADTGYSGTFTDIPGPIIRSILPISGGLLLIITFKKLFNLFRPSN